MPTTKRKTTSDAVEILHRRFYEGRPERLAELEAARASAAVARAAYELRTKAKLSQRELARRVGLAPAMIAQLEDDDFEGDMLALLQRIAVALNKTVEIRVWTSHPPCLNVPPSRRPRRTGLLAGRRISTGMIAHEDDRSGVVADDLVEGVARVHDARGERAE